MLTNVIAIFVDAEIARFLLLTPVFAILLVLSALEFPYTDYVIYVKNLKTSLSSRHSFLRWWQTKTPAGNPAAMFLKTFALEPWIVLIINFNPILRE